MTAIAQPFDSRATNPENSKQNYEQKNRRLGRIKCVAKNRH